MKEVLILSGLPGSGKSTWARARVSALPTTATTAVVSADDYFVRLGGGTYKFVADRIGDAHLECFRRFVEELTKDTNLVIVDNCNIEAVVIAPYYMLAQALDYEVKIIRIECDADYAFRRTTHAVPAATFALMREKFEAEKRNFPPWWEVTVGTFLLHHPRDGKEHS